MAIYLTRHSEATHNAEGIFAGSQIDSSLTEQGKLEAIQRGKDILAKYKIDRIIVSGLQRSQQTGRRIAREIASEEILEINLDLNEVDVGSFSGKSRSEAHLIDPLALHTFIEGEVVDWQFPAGQSFRSIKDRSDRFIETLAEYQGNTLVIGHAMINRVILNTTSKDIAGEFAHTQIIEL